MTNRRIGVNDVGNTNYHNDHDPWVETKAKQHKENGQVCCEGLFCTTQQGKDFKQSTKAETLPDLWKTVMSDHIDTRRKIKGIASVSSFYSLINSVVLSPIDKQILILHYIDEKDFRFIGDTLGYSESTIKKKHRKILAKLSKVL